MSLSRLSQCALWDNMVEFYREKGCKAWGKGGLVPRITVLQLVLLSGAAVQVFEIFLSGLWSIRK